MKALRAIRMAVYVSLVATLISGCKRTRTVDTDSSGSSLIFGGASPEAQEALATPVDFRLTEENFVAWEAAQRNLDALPRSALPSGASGAANPIDRAVNRLESSPRARTAIERTGLTVRDFVLETIALAQATEALAAGNSASVRKIPPENLQFVQAHRSRMLLAQRRRQAPAQSEASDVESTAGETAAVAPVTLQPAEVGTNQSADSSGSGAVTDERSDGRSTQRPQQRDTAPNTQMRQPVHDSVRDTVPPPR